MANINLSLVLKTGATLATVNKQNAAFRRFGKTLDLTQKKLDRLSASSKRQGAAAQSAGRKVRKAADDTTRLGVASTKTGKSLGAMRGKVLALAAGVLVLGAAFTKIASAGEVFGEVETGLLAVGKTTNLADSSLSKLNDRLSTLAVGDLPIIKTEMLAIASAAGQVGVRGVQNLTEYTDVLGQLAAASDVVGDEGTRSITRIMNIEGEGPDQVREFASTLVLLGNEAAATESEILGVANRVALGTAAFKIGSPAVLGFSTAMKEVGIQAQLGGSVIGRTFREMSQAVLEGGEVLTEFARIAGVSADEFRETWARSSVEAVNLFLKGLGRFGEAAPLELKKVGLIGNEINQVLPVLAVNFETLALRQRQAAEEAQKVGTGLRENTALAIESSRAFDSQASDVTRTKNAYQLLQESFGAGFSSDFRGAMGEMRDRMTENRALAESFGRIAGGALLFIAENSRILADGLAVLVAIKVGTFFVGAAAGANAFLVALSPITLALGGLLAVVLLVNNSIRQLGDSYAQETARMVAETNKAGAALGQIRTAAAEAIERGDSGELEKMFSGLRDSVAEANQEFLESRSALRKLQDNLKRATRDGNKLAGQQDRITEATTRMNAANTKVGALREAFNLVGEALDTLPDKIDTVGDALGGGSGGRVSAGAQALLDRFRGANRILIEQERLMRDVGLSGEEAARQATLYGHLLEASVDPASRLGLQIRLAAANTAIMGEKTRELAEQMERVATAADRVAAAELTADDLRGSAPVPGGGISDVPLIGGGINDSGLDEEFLGLMTVGAHIIEADLATIEWNERLVGATFALVGLGQELGIFTGQQARNMQRLSSLGRSLGETIGAEGGAGGAIGAAAGAFAGMIDLGRTGNSVAAGAEAGNQILPGWGALIGAFVGLAVDMMHQTAQTFANGSTEGGRLVARLELGSGDLIKQANAATMAITDTVNGVLDAIGGTFTEFTTFAFQIREDSQGIRVWINDVKTTFGEDLQGAIDFAVTEIFKQTTVTGGSPAVMAALEQFKGSTVGELQEVLTQAMQIDDLAIPEAGLQLRNQLQDLNRLLIIAIKEIGVGAENVLSGPGGVVSTIQDAYNQAFGIQPDIEAQTRANIEAVQAQVEIQKASLLALKASLVAEQARGQGLVLGARVMVLSADAAATSSQALGLSLGELAGAELVAAQAAIAAAGGMSAASQASVDALAAIDAAMGSLNALDFSEGAIQQAIQNAFRGSGGGGRRLESAIQTLGGAIEATRATAQGWADALHVLEVRLNRGRISAERFEEILGEFALSASQNLLGQASSIFQIVGDTEAAAAAAAQAEEFRLVTLVLQLQIMREQALAMGVLSDSVAAIIDAAIEAGAGGVAAPVFALSDQARNDLDFFRGISDTAGRLAEIRERYENERLAAEATGASLLDLKDIRDAERGALARLREELLDSVRGYLDLAAGIGSFERRLIDTLATISAVESGLAEVDAAGGGPVRDGVGHLEDTVVSGIARMIDRVDALFGGLVPGLVEVTDISSQLDSTMGSLSAATAAAVREIGFDFVNSLGALGVSLPVETTLMLAEAQFQLAKIQALSAVAALAAAGFFEEFGINMQVFLDAIEAAKFELSDFAPQAPQAARVVDKAFDNVGRDLVNAWQRVLEEMTSALEARRFDDPRLTGKERFDMAQERFRGLVAAARGGDLDAAQQVNQARLDLEREAESFFGGGRGGLAVFDEITKALESVRDVAVGQVGDPVESAVLAGNRTLVQIRDAVLAIQPQDVVHGPPVTRPGVRPDVPIHAPRPGRPASPLGPTIGGPPLAPPVPLGPPPAGDRAALHRLILEMVRRESREGRERERIAQSRVAAEREAARQRESQRRLMADLVAQRRQDRYGRTGASGE